jgi:hypothetical protein
MFYTCTAGTPNYDWKPGKAHATADAAEIAARRLHKSLRQDINILRLEPGQASRKSEYVATVLTDALGRVWTQVGQEGGRFL